MCESVSPTLSGTRAVAAAREPEHQDVKERRLATGERAEEKKLAEQIRVSADADEPFAPVDCDFLHDFLRGIARAEP